MSISSMIILGAMTIVYCTVQGHSWQLILMTIFYHHRLKSLENIRLSESEVASLRVSVTQPRPIRKTVFDLVILVRVTAFANELGIQCWNSR